MSPLTPLFRFAPQKTVFKILAKSLALAAMDLTDEDGVPLCLAPTAIPDED